MRWKIKQRKQKVEGSIRKRQPFAIFPTRIGDVIVWLERYEVKEKLCAVAMFDEGGYVYPELRWVEISRETITYYY